MCDPVSATAIATLAIANMAIPMTRESSPPPPYVPPPPPPAPKISTQDFQPFQHSPGALSLGAKSPFETKLKARQRRHRHLPASTLAGLNIPSAGDGGNP